MNGPLDNKNVNLKTILRLKTASVFHLDYGKNELIKSPKKAKKFGKASGLPDATNAFYLHIQRHIFN